MAGMKARLKAMLPLSVGYFLRKQFLRYRGLYYKGKGHYCPICNQEYRTFFDGGFDLPIIEKMQIIGGGRRKTILCPGCSSSDRDRLMHQLLISTDFQDAFNGKILHIAPEPALFEWITKNHPHPSQYLQGVKYHEGFYYPNLIPLMDIQSIPHPDNTFDLVICNHVLEHVDDDHQAMKELLRVLKSGGKAILQVPWSPVLDKTIEDIHCKSDQEREERFGQFDHVRLYGTDYPDLLSKAGFLVSVYDHQKLGLNNSQLDYLSLNAKEHIFVGTKQV